jgi:hypothetical protein
MLEHDSLPMSKTGTLGLERGSGRGNARGIGGGLLAYRDGIFDVQIAGRLAQAATHAFALAGRVTGGIVMTLFRRVRHRSSQVEFTIAACVRARIDEVRTRWRVQNDGLRCRRLRRLVAEREVDANGGEIRKLHAQFFRSHAVATLLFAQEISCPFGADGREFHVGASHRTRAGIEPTRASTTEVLATTVSAATTTAATAAGLVLGFIDLQRATAEVLAVQGLHGLLGVRARHFDEAEAARLARVTVIDERDFFHVAVGREQGAHRIFGSAEGKISNVKFGQEKYSLGK